MLLLDVRHMELGNLTTVKSDRNLLSLSLAPLLSAMELFNNHNENLSRMPDSVITG